MRGIAAAILTATTAILTGGLILTAGCGKRKPAATPPPPKRAYVRLSALTARHPLQEEVRLLRDAEGRIRRLADIPSSRPTVGALTLPALPETALRADLARAAAERRKTMRDRVQRVADRELRAFADISANRLDLLNEQRRAELLAELATEFEGRIHGERDGILNGVRDRLYALVERKLVIRARLAVLRAQLDPDAPIPLPAPEPAVLNAEIAKLDADANALGISQRARLERKRRDELAKLTQVNKEIAAAQAEGERQIAAMTTRIQKELNDEVARRLAAERVDRDFEPELRAQQKMLAADLDNEAQIALAALRTARAIAEGPGLRPVDLDRIFGVARSVPTNAGGAAARIAAQRLALEREIETSVAETVQDVARNENMDVLLVRGQPAPTEIQGRADLTGEFIRWIEPGGIPPGLSEGIGS